MITLLPQFIMTACIVIYVSIYLVGMKKGTVRPILATWLLFSLATVMSVITDYRESGIHDLLANSFNIVDTLACLVVLTILLVFKKYQRGTFTTFEKICLYAVGIVFIAWLISGQNIVAHLAIQAILLVGYIPTWVHLWRTRKNTESLGMWFFDFAASAIGLIAPIQQGALLPIIYGVRATLSTLVVIILVFRLEYRNRKTKSLETHI